MEYHTGLSEETFAVVDFRRLQPPKKEYAFIAVGTLAVSPREYQSAVCRMGVGAADGRP